MNKLGHGEIDTDITQTRVVVLVEDDKYLVGFVTFNSVKKTLEIVRVNRARRRRGYGTLLVQLADQYSKTTLMDTGYRSPQGSQLLKKMKRKTTKFKGRPPQCGEILENALLTMFANRQIKFFNYEHITQAG